MTAPCKDCDKKGCGEYHSKCSIYLEYRAEVDAKSNALSKRPAKRPWYSESHYKNRGNNVKCHKK